VKKRYDLPSIKPDGREMGRRSGATCEERSRLLQELNDAALDASRAARELADFVGIASRDDFNLLVAEKYRARARVRRAEILYRYHMRHHGCVGFERERILAEQGREPVPVARSIGSASDARSGSA
jgi:hypothetical protein